MLMRCIDTLYVIDHTVVTVVYGQLLSIRGWYAYYGAFHRSALGRLAESLNNALVKWVMHKYLRFKGHKRRAREWLAAVAYRAPGLFAHWEGGKAFAPAGR